MDLCEFGCGLPATHTQKNGKKICNTNASKCPELRKKNGAGNKGKKKDPKWIAKIKESNLKYWAEHKRVAWNKGLTKDDHPGMMAVSDAQKLLAEKQIQKIIPDDHHAYTNYKSYRTRITSRSKKIYRENLKQLNPGNVVLGISGDDVYHLDHIYPVIEGFRRDIPIEIMAGLDNLQLLPATENVRKSNDITEIPKSIKTYLTENK